MNLLLLDPSEVDAEGVVRLDGRRAEHLRLVLGVEPGRLVRAGLVDGPTGRAEVLEVAKGLVSVRFAAAPDAVAESDPAADAGHGEVDLIVGLPRPQVLHRVLQTAAAMGVRRLDLVNAWRVEKSYFQSPSLAPEQVRRQLLLGAEQGLTTRLPRVSQQRLLVPFVRSLADAQQDEGPLRLLAHPQSELDLEQAVLAAATPGLPVQLAVGPEGGWIDREVQTFGESGFVPVRLGGWVLRVEVALAVALGQLAAARRIARRRSTGSPHRG